VFQLRNRVRLLELEHKRAMKKIQEASKRAESMADLKNRNDQRFMEKVLREEAKRQQLREEQQANFDKQKGQKQGIQEARFSMYLVKNQQVKNVKQILTDEKRRYAEEKSFLDSVTN